jgi:FHS family L-fucose permease-like MFS transporter
MQTPSSISITADPASNLSPTARRTALIAVTTLFFMWGFITVLNDILVPHLKSVFDLTYLQASMIQFVFFTAYFVMSLPAGKIISWVGYQNGMVLGLLTTGLGTLLFYPAASFLSYNLFLGALFVLATGITILQVAANPYISVLGKPETASSRLNLAQAFNSLGTTLAPWVGGGLILAQLAVNSTKLEEAASVKVPYLELTAILVLLAVVLAFIKLPALPAVEEDTEHPGTLWDALKIPHVALGSLGIFLYVGAEVSIGSYLINFIADPDIAGFTKQTAADYVAYYWGGAMVGRFVGSALQQTNSASRLITLGVTCALILAVMVSLLAFGLILFLPVLILIFFMICSFIASVLLQNISANRLLAFNATFTTLLALIGLLTNGPVALWSVLAIGLFNSIMFPNIFTLGIAGLGHLTSRGSSLLIMAIVGGALVPAIMGKMADMFGIHHSLFVPAICYLFIIYYGLSGYRDTRSTNA